MGARKCSVAGCLSTTIRTQDRGITFHRFPAKEQIRNAWIASCRMESNANITKATNVCSRHFHKEDFQDFKGKKYMLKQNIVPSIFPWRAEQKEEQPKKITKKKIAAAKAAAESEKKSKLEAQMENAAAKEMKKIGSSSTLENSLSKTSAKLEAETKKEKKKSAINFTAFTKIEAQDFNEEWHLAEIMEVDLDEREALIHFDKTQKGKLSLSDEWIPMDSCRLRPVSSPVTVTPVEVPVKPPAVVPSTSITSKTVVTSPAPTEHLFKVGEKCLARWSDSRKFRATIQKILENDAYEVLFDDGFLKNVKGIHITKLKSTAKDTSPPTPVPVPVPIIKAISLQEQNLAARKLITDNVNIEDLPKIPEEGEWCCHWVNEIPIGENCELDTPTGKLFTVKVPDSRLPIGWTKHIYQRGNINGKWDIILMSQSGRKFRSKGELKQFLEEIGEEYNPERYDFSLHKKRSKEVGLITTITASTILPNDALSPTVPLASSAIISVIESPVNEVCVGSLKVKFFNNLYHCPKEDCNKYFRKENHLQIHIKHYHKDMEKLLGVCPNMQDLALLRTNADEIDSIAPTKIRKTNTPLSNPTSPIASSGSINTVKEEVVVKVETPAPTIVVPETPKQTKKDPLIVTSTPILTSSTATIKKDSESATKKIEIKDDTIEIKQESVAPTSTVRRKVVTPRRGRKTKRKLHSRNFLNRYSGVPMPKQPKLSLSESFNDSDETRLSFGQNSENVNYSTSFQSYINENITSDANSGADSLQNMPDTKAAIPKYINENGEVIKIVRMRKEEIINCICQFGEEDGLMIQCELCLCWQHGSCNGIEKENQVPDKYICFICKNPERGRESKKYIHDQDWLYDGKLPVANYHVINSKAYQQRFDLLKQSHTLTGNLLEIKRYLHSLRVKINIAENKDHPKLYYWSKKWEPASPSKTVPVQSHVVRTSAAAASDLVIDSLNIENNKLPSYEIGDQDSISKSEQDSINNSILAGLLSSPTATQGTPTVPTETATIAQEDIKILNQDVKMIEIEMNKNVPIIPQPEEAIDSTACQFQLLQHIQRQQNLAMTRLQSIEAQIIALEAHDENLIESPYQNNSFPKTKQTIKMLINDVGKMRKFASIHKEPPVVHHMN